MKFNGNKIVLEYGCIEIEITEKGREYHKYPVVEFTTTYERSDYNIYKYRTFDSLESAHEWYEKVDLNMRGI